MDDVDLLVENALRRMLDDESDNMGEENSSFVEYGLALDEKWRREMFG